MNKKLTVREAVELLEKKVDFFVFFDATTGMFLGSGNARESREEYGDCPVTDITFRTDIETHKPIALLKIMYTQEDEYERWSNSW